MKAFYFLRHEDVNGYSGEGVVAEGVIFDSGAGAFTWLTEYPTVTVFQAITDIKHLHGHKGKTDVVIDGNDDRFETCQEEARRKKSLLRRQEKDENS